LKERYFSIAQKMKNSLAKDIPIISFRIFGSCAREEEEFDSDMDVFIEVETLSQQVKNHIRYISWQLGLDTETVISPLIFSRDEIENSPLRLSSIVQNILREGIAI
jgi:predicted nucleotidyltransferase